jgi:hypothetical protein
MTKREQRVYEEASALWREVFGEPPPLQMDGATMLEIVTRSVDDVSYRRVFSPFLRPSTIVGPSQPWDDSQLG